MEIKVYGSAFLANGERPDIVEEIRNGIAHRNNKKVRFAIEIIDKYVIFTIFEGMDNEPTDEIIRLSRYIIDNTIALDVLKKGVGFMYTIDYIKRGENIDLATVDRAPDLEIGPSPQRIDVFNLMGRIPLLRYAMRDFNMGLIYREDCPMYFYRAVETIAKSILKLEDNLENKNWENFHELIKSTDDERIDLKEILTKYSKSHRHGSHLEFDAEQHLKMMKTTKRFLLKSIMFLNSKKEMYLPEI